nr:uncharacterized protein LOC120976512 isoform X1 [Aegilops tauschii subsp. strangulata]
MAEASPPIPLGHFLAMALPLPFFGVPYSLWILRSLCRPPVPPGKPCRCDPDPALLRPWRPSRGVGTVGRPTRPRGHQQARRGVAEPLRLSSGPGEQRGDGQVGGRPAPVLRIALEKKARREEREDVVGPACHCHSADVADLLTRLSGSAFHPRPPKCLFCERSLLECIFCLKSERPQLFNRNSD